MNHKTVTLPAGVVRDVFAKQHPDRLLHLLAETDEPLLYTHAREGLDLHAEQFARALRSLEKWGLVQLRVVPKRERPDGRRRVQIQLTALGRAVVRLHGAVDREWQKIAREESLNDGALA